MAANATAGLTEVGFIGLGVMGKGMARSLMRVGIRFRVHNRSSASVEALVAEGALDGGSPMAIAQACEVVLLCLPDTPDVEAVLFGPGGVAEGAAPGSVVIDTSTIAAGATRRFAARLAERDVTLIDCPVSGGPKGAAEGTLSCMLGGDAAAIERCAPVFDAIGAKRVHLGPAGAGQLVKSCNQLVIAATLLGVSEAIAMCMAAGVDPSAMRDALLAGSAQSFVLQNHGKRLLDGALAPGFRGTLMLKDLTLALNAGRDLGSFTPATALAVQLFTAHCHGEGADQDSAAVGRLVQQLSGLEMA